MTLPKRHRNITIQRLVLDFYQFVRAQSFVNQLMGKQFSPSSRYIEIDLTYHCNLKCFNCNRSCTQAPDRSEIPFEAIATFIKQSAEQGRMWKRIRLLGGEPTLHSRIFDIIEMLTRYQAHHNPGVRLVLCTNYYGSKVRRVLKKMPDNIVIKSTLKHSRIQLFKPFNVAPCDQWFNRFSDYSSGCRIIEECGLGLTPSGYYMCAVAGGIDRIFGRHLGRQNLPELSDSFSDQMEAFCRVCGHFGFQWPTRKVRMSDTWRRAYQAYENREQSMDDDKRNITAEKRNPIIL